MSSRQDREAAVDRAWTQLAGPGPTLSSGERRQIITDARAAWAGRSLSGDRGPIGDATYAVAVDAEGLTLEMVESFEARALDRLSYLEVVGVVARLSNIDWYCRATNRPLPQLPSRNDIEAPTGAVHPDADMTDSWVPMLGLASAPLALDALPDEGNALRDLLEPMYIDMSDIVNWTFADELNRPQIEVLAARVSYLNECFY